MRYQRKLWGGVATRPRRVLFGIVLAVGMGAGAIPGFAYGVLGPLLLDEYGLVRSQLGLLTSATFLVGGSASLTAGGLVDRVGARRVLVATIAMVGAALLGMALIRSFAAMVVLAAVAGVGVAAGNPTTNRIIATHLGPDLRGTVMGLKQSGVQVTGFAARAVLGPAAITFGWRPALATAAAASLFGIAVVLRFVPPDGPARSRAVRRVDQRRPLPPSVKRLAVYAALLGMGIAIVNTYLPLYTVEAVGYSPVVASWLVAFMAVFGTVFRVVWGTVSGRSHRYYTILIGMAAVGATSVVALLVAQLFAWLVWMGVALFGITVLSWNTVGMLAVLRSVPLDQTGRASAALMLGFFSGFVMSPLAFGALVDATDSYTLGWSVVIAAYLLAAVVVMPLRTQDELMARDGCRR